MPAPRRTENYLTASHFWLATVQEVLQADWQEDWHLPQPPLAAVALRSALLMVVMCFKRNTSFLSYVSRSYRTVDIISYFSNYFKGVNAIFYHADGKTVNLHTPFSFFAVYSVSTSEVSPASKLYVSYRVNTAVSSVSVVSSYSVPE